MDLKLCESQAFLANSFLVFQEFDEKRHLIHEYYITTNPLNKARNNQLTYSDWKIGFPDNLYGEDFERLCEAQRLHILVTNPEFSLVREVYGRY